MEQAMALITMELACAMGREQNEIQGEIENIFHDVLKKNEL
jgi:hypothetical protein